MLLRCSRLVVDRITRCSVLLPSAPAHVPSRPVDALSQYRRCSTVTSTACTHADLLGIPTAPLPNTAGLPAPRLSHISWIAPAGTPAPRANASRASPWR